MIQLNVEFLPYDEIAIKAYDFLVKFGSEKDIPVPIEEIAEFGLKVDIVPTPGLLDVFDIDGGTACDLSTIYVDEFIYKRRPTRFRFTLAHECGHIFLHRKYFRMFEFESISRWQDFQDQIDHDDYSRLEFQGYAFGGLVLVPRHHLKPVFEEKLPELQHMIDKAMSQGFSRESYISVSMDKMASLLAPIFDVSTDVMIKRIEFDKLQNLIP